MDTRWDRDIKIEVKERMGKIKVLLMDVDGVLTDGRLFYLPGADGKPVEFKGFNSHDGLGFHFLNSVGIKTGVISGRESPATVERARILKMSYVYQGLLEKEGAYGEVLQKAKVTAEEVAYIGDDFTDVPLMLKSGLGCCVGDARQELKDVAHFVTKAPGGHGAVREVIELILKAQDKWDGVLEKYGLLEKKSKPSIGFSLAKS
jgi:3-deoxy-D-manno-octulosonate 8-phosphate phosphatase (KDO 8-P phosphatase)